MGNQSRRKKKGAASTRVAPPSYKSNNDDNNDKNDKWSMLVPFQTLAEMKDAANDAIEKLQDSNIPTSKVPSWRVYIRRANLWFESAVKPKKKRIHGNYRPWIVTFFLATTSQTDTSVDLVTSASCMVHNDESIHVDPRNSPLTSCMFWASLGQMMDKLQSKPRELIFWPAVGGAFRIRHLQTFVSSLQQNDFHMSLLPAQEPEHNAPDSCTKAILLINKSNNPEVQLFAYDNSKLVRFLEEQLNVWEEGVMNMQGHRDPSFWIPGIAQTLELSVNQLQQLFQASCLFHQAKPWELLSNFNPVKIILPEDYTCRELYAVIVGNGSYDARGLYFYKSLANLKTAGTGSMSNRDIVQSVLRFCERTETPFGTLNQVEELGLDIATNDGADGEHSYPSWYSTSVLPSDGPPTEEQLWAMQSTPPPLEDIPALTIATAAIAKLVTSRLVHAMDDEHGETRTTLPIGQVPVQVDLLNQQAAVVVMLECLQLNPMDFMPSNEHMMASLSVGDRNVCNYCQKLRYLVPGKRLLACGRCYSVDYCSKACQLNDFARHKQECKRLAASRK